MQLIHALTAGVAGAELGFATIYRRGTSTSPTLYASFEGDLHPQSGQDVDLDSYGRAVVYVNELVDVIAYNSDGASVAEFVEGQAAPNVEVRSLSFTGSDYDTGAQAPGNPTNLQVVLDRWETSAGAPDWKVNVNGSDQDLQDVIGDFAGIFINVRSPLYGAVGDGTTNDTPAIQAAITAAGVSKKTVYFPAGTYRITSGLTVPVDVNLWGSGAGGSIIYLDHATASALTYGSGTSLSYQEIRGLQVIAAQTNTGNTINITSAGTRFVAVINCLINFVNNTGHGISADGAGHRVLVDGTPIRVNGNLKSAVTANLTAASFEIRNSSLLLIATAYSGNVVNVSTLKMTNVTVDVSSQSSGASAAVFITGDNGRPADVSIVGCRFRSQAGGTCSCFNYGVSYLDTGSAFAESANTIQPGFTFNYVSFTIASATPTTILATRESRETVSTDNTASVNVLADQYGTFVLTRTTAAAQALTTSIPPTGGKFTLSVFNNSGGALGTISFGSGFATNTPSILALANGKLATYQFQAVYLAGGLALVPLGAYTTVL